MMPGEVVSGIWDFLVNLLPWTHWRRNPDYDAAVDDATILREPMDWIGG